MFRSRGIKLVEVLTAMSILLVLAGLVFVASGSSREGAKQTVCISQLRQINAAMQLYAIDYPECVYGSSVTFAFGVRASLRPYGLTDEIEYCPDTPTAIRGTVGSTYFWNTMLWPPNEDPGWIKRRNLKIERMMQEGSSFVVVECDVHDQVYYQPRERDVDPLLLGAFRIQLFADGSVHRGRVDTMRSQLFLGGS